MCTVRKHGSITFDLISLLFDHKWAKHIKPTPQYVKGGASASLCMGRSTVFCSPSPPLSLRHFIHLNKRLLTAALQQVILYPKLLSSFKVASLPP